MARTHAKTNNSHKSAQKKPEAPPPALQPGVSTAPVKQEAARKQEAAPARQAEPAPAPVREGPSAEQISYRAYELFLERGGEHGRHEDDWNRAERELRLGR